VPNSAKPPVCAIVVTFHPPADLPARIAALGRQVQRIIVVDNGSDRQQLEKLLSESLNCNLELVLNGTNLGVASALNIGISLALRQGFLWALTLDQDSTPSEQMVHALWSTVAAAVNPSDIAIVAPAIKQVGFPKRPYKWLKPHPKARWLYARSECTGAEIDVSVAITSGSLVNIEVWESIGKFSERLFIDYVDTEYCLRAMRNGKRVIVNCSAVLWHSLGARTKKRTLLRDFYPTNHAPFRHYYIARNRIHVLRLHGLAVPHWLFFDLLAAVFTIFRVLIAEENRKAKLKAIILGTLDGLANRSGKNPHSELERPHNAKSG